jgi:hypothetical protein
MYLSWKKNLNIVKIITLEEKYLFIINVWSKVCNVCVCDGGDLLCVVWFCSNDNQP